MANTRVYIVPSSDGKQRSAYPSGNWTNVAAPSGLTATVDGSTIVFQLTDTNAGAAAYVIQRSATLNGVYSDFVTGSTGATTITQTGNAPGTFYYRAFGQISGVRSASASNSVSATIAAPSSAGDGDTVRIVIPGAGSNVPASNFQFLGGSYGPIENGTVGDMFTAVAPPNWEMLGGTGSQISIEQALNGTKSLLHDRARGFQFGIAYDSGAPRRVGFARWSFRFENPNGITGGQLKQVRMVGGTSSRMEDYSYANCYLSGWTGGNGVYAARNDSPSVGANLSGGSGREWHKEGEWITVHFRCTDSSAAGVADASIQVLTIRESTGEIIGLWNQTNVLLRNAAAALIRSIVFQFYMGNMFNGASGCKLHLDRDIACAFSDTTTPPKFLYLGNAATWSACTVRTYCEWETWTDNGATSTIDAIINQGRHSSLNNLYFYALSDAGVVINSTGVPLP